MESGLVESAEWKFRGLSFLTAAEVSEILKVNHQVLLRRLQGGEIPAYKIGKDWRIEESELRRWLESVSNRNAVEAAGTALGGSAGASSGEGARAAAAKAEEESIRRHFFVAGRLTTIPARRSKREVVLRMLARRFAVGRTYREAEVNTILKSVHPDFCTLRRELVMAKLLERDKGRYWRPEARGTPPEPLESTSHPATSSESTSTAAPRSPGRRRQSADGRTAPSVGVTVERGEGGAPTGS
jgi:excisionase family DNA binding protein